MHFLAPCWLQFSKAEDCFSTAGNHKLPMFLRQWPSGLAVSSLGQDAFSAQQLVARVVHRDEQAATRFRLSLS